MCINTHASVRGLRDTYIHTHVYLHAYVCMNIVKKCNLPHYVFIVLFVQFNIANNKIILKELILILP